MNFLPVFLSLFPFLVFTILLLRGKTSLIKTSILTLCLFILEAIFYWNILPSQLPLSFGKGFFVALDIFIIIFGAILFLDLLEKTGTIGSISRYLEHFSGDYRLQIILLAWLFEAFIEGTAGFGTPVAIVAPLLVGLGLTPLKALIVSLMGNSTAVVFGAAGTPIRVGFAGLDIHAIPLTSALMNCIGFIVPIFMLWIITRGRDNRRKEFLDGLPFAAWAGIAFVLPSLLSVFLGQEFPSIIGSVIGILLVLITTKLGFFVPKERISLRKQSDIPAASMSPSRAFFPYALLILLLVFGKIFLGNSGILISLGFSHFFSWFNPGFAFIAASICVACIWRKKGMIGPLVPKALARALDPFLIIFSMSVLVQLMTNSGQNGSGLPSAITLIGTMFEIPSLPFFVPFIGAFGSFITGSATISNVMFGNLLNTVASFLGIDTTLILSLAVVGGAAGNMIALADMLAGQAVLGMKNQERSILKGVLIPCGILLLLTGGIGLIFS